MKPSIPLLVILFSMTIWSCQQNTALDNVADKTDTTTIGKIQVLNLGTFHFGHTDDATSTEFDEHNSDNRTQAHEIAKALASFKPTVIVIESPPSYTANWQKIYEDYIEDPSIQYLHPSEIQLLAFEVGRLSGAEHIYGIDHQMPYNYRIDEFITNTTDSATCQSFNKFPLKNFPGIESTDHLPLLDQLKAKNTNEYLDFMMTTNAEILTHAATDSLFEGADEAALFYQRNLRMYTNLNRLKLTTDDRVFILMGAAHTAFFRGFLNRSPKYEMVNTFDYLKASTPSRISTIFPIITRH